jgi:type IV pilus assembly protein PilY1
MRMTTARTWTAASATVALVLAPATARAQQVDVNPPLPNVLLMIDNSGSMERMIDGTLPSDNASSTCNCDATTGTCTWSPQPTPNRWGTMLQALTGTLQNGYNCAAMPRNPGSVFANEYQINGVAPYDINYYLPYHRPIAKDPNGACVYAPGTLPGANNGNGVGPSGTGAGGLATDFPSNAIVQHTYGTAGTKSCTFAQYQDGALDSQLDIMRFGMMMFDQDPDPSTGVTAGNKVANPAFTGMWSYFPGWNSGGASPYSGAPANCSTLSPFTVGARNAAAPPWEGRMMPFPTTTDLPTQEALNANIQQVLLASRPYGATPLGGMFKGAQYYLETDPSGPQQMDTFVKGGCRNQYIILLTDGAPNLDMRHACEATGAPNGVCPFALPEQTAAALYNNATTPTVTTFVIGFAVSQVQDSGTIYCSSLVSGGTLDAKCSDPLKQAVYGPCCELQRIALNGGSSHAYFADTSGDLQNALGTILSLIAKNTTTRTMPAYSPVITQGVVADPKAPKTSESVFLASFIPSPGRPWSGDVQRQRYLCKSAGSTYTVQAPAPDPTLGDDFAANLNSNTSARAFVALQPDAVVDSSATIRPYVATTVGDGLGKYSAVTYPDTAANVIAKISPTALGLTATSCSYNPTTGGPSKYLSAALCRDMLFDYTFGQPFSTNPGDFPFVSRAGIAFGDVFHATPIVVGPPGSLLRDDSYIAFASTSTKSGSRQQIVYVATNDGLLHAFWADETKLENNEIWAMLPPAVMPNLLTSYPSSHQFLLDGSPVVKDVVWDRTVASQGKAGNWHTMLVAGFGPNQTGYYAVDVTNPYTAGMTPGVVPTDPPSSGPPTGPVFMWQLTKMPATNAPLFGPHSATPAITTLFVDPDGTGAREIGVAILPGGQDLPASNTACARATKATDAAPVNTYKARTSVRCWGKNQKATDPVFGRSVSIVRLDTGEILRVFMRLADVPVATDTLYPKRIIDTPLDSPMTGIPVVYPADVGTDATKVFIGDADGTIWRFDLSSSDPTKWVGELFLDLYNQTADISATSWGDGQPIQLPPVTSLDPNGNVVLNVATGIQDVFDSTGVDYVYSITEAVNTLATPTRLRATVNWWLDPSTVTTQTGERVSGPMTVFDGVLYFATYGAASPGAQSCTSGHGRIWGLDFVTPADTKALAKGGLPRLNPLPASHNQYVQPDESDSSLLGVVIPGVSIKATPACAGLGTAGSDAYVAGASHSAPANYTGGQFSVFTQLGTKGANGAATRQFELTVPTPSAPTVIDSWAAVIE